MYREREMERERERERCFMFKHIQVSTYCLDNNTHVMLIFIPFLFISRLELGISYTLSI